MNKLLSTLRNLNPMLNYLKLLLAAITGAAIFFAGAWVSWGIGFNAGYIKGRLTRINMIAPTDQDVEVDPQGSSLPIGKSFSPEELESALKD